jgi:hypothetical protein
VAIAHGSPETRATLPFDAADTRHACSRTIEARFTVNASISDSTWISAGPQPVSVTNAGEAIILDPASNRYYSLDGVGELVWRLLQQQTRLPDLCEAVLAEFEVDPDEARRDVRALIDELLEAGLVVVSESPGK